MARSTRDTIISAAAKLFSNGGIRAVSVDAIASSAGITKRTLYYHFKSKDDLIAAYLQTRDLPNVALFQRWFAENPGDVADKTRAIFTHLAVTVRHPKWRGCGFLRTSAELIDVPGHPALKIGRAHKRRVEIWLAESFAAAGTTHPPALARQVMLLMDGAFAAGLLHRDSSYMEAAGDAAVTLIRAAQNVRAPGRKRTLAAARSIR